MGPEILDRENDRIKESSLRLFHTTRKMGGPEFSQNYAERLEEEIQDLYGNYVKHNESKNIFAAARTPAVLFAIMVLCYLVSGVLGVIGLETLANCMNLVMGLALIMLSVWAYIRYSGDYREVGMQIDSLAEVIWEKVGPVLKEHARSVADRHLKHKVKLTSKRRHKKTN